MDYPVVYIIPGQREAYQQVTPDLCIAHYAANLKSPSLLSAYFVKK